MASHTSSDPHDHAPVVRRSNDLGNRDTWRNTLALLAVPGLLVLLVLVAGSLLGVVMTNKLQESGHIQCGVESATSVSATL